MRFSWAAAGFFSVVLISTSALAASPTPAASPSRPAPVAPAGQTAPFVAGAAEAVPAPRPVVRKTVRRRWHHRRHNHRIRRIRHVAAPAPMLPRRCFFVFCEGPVLLIGVSGY
jgi:hypothetical protein